ncbi:MAG: hypothetical protein WCF12_15250 [Propionicimonas sp.]
MTDRQSDLVLYGATGYTGGIVADYLATAAARLLCGRTRHPDHRRPGS